MTRIVVGVDGSSTSKRAMQRAVEEGKLRGGTVVAVLAYEPGDMDLTDDFVGLARSAAAPMRYSGAGQSQPSHDQLAQQEAERRLGEFVEDALAGVDGPQPHLLALPRKDPATALIEESEAADLLVVGTRGLGGLKEMVLGSVAHQCIQESHCPVLVMPAEAD